MSEIRTLLERKQTELHAPAGSFERLILRRDRKRRNQRIAAGVVGIAVFVAAIWIVTSGLSLDRSEKSVAPAGPAETAPPPDPASAAPDVVEERTCSDGARWRLEITDTGDQIKVRFEVHRSPPGHSWRIHLGHMEHNILPCCGHTFFRGDRVASDGGDLVVQLARPDWRLNDGVRGEAVDRQTGQVCRVFVWYQ